jgi:hypothetical protein
VSTASESARHPAAILYNYRDSMLAVVQLRLSRAHPDRAGYGGKEV